MRGAALLALLCLAPAARAAEPAILPAEWEAYRAAFVEPTGRVVDDANGRISHSESQGYGLLLAVLAGNRADFEAMWSFTRAELMVRDDGLAAWKWDPTAQPRVADVNNAADGDILIAYALDRAAGAWDRPDYRDAAKALAEALGRHAVAPTPAGPVLLPGATGFDAGARPDGPVVNLSYWVLEAFPMLARLDPATDWPGVAATGRALIGAAGFGPRRLPPEWLSLKGTPAPAEGFAPEFGYNALRIPLYLLRGGVRDPDLLARFHKGMDEGGDLAIGPLTGDAPWTALADPGYRAIVALVGCGLGGDPLPAELRTFAPTNYYPSTLHLLALAHAREAMPQCV
jgi:endo-1,4-beta-D-glucanase Y